LPNDLGYVEGVGFEVYGSGFTVSLGWGGTIFPSGIVPGSGFRVQGSGFRVHGSGFKV